MLDYTQTRLRLYTRAFIWRGSMQITTRGRSVYELEWTLAPRGVNGFAWRLTTATSFACIVCRHYRKSSVSPRVQVWLSIGSPPRRTSASSISYQTYSHSLLINFTDPICSRQGQIFIFPLFFLEKRKRFLSISSLGIKSQWSNPT